jgi:autotransporter-associated beta strand protein
LDLNGNNQVVASLADSAGTGGSVTTGIAGSINLSLNTTTATSFSGVIQDGSGQVSLTIAGSGSQTLSGANTYSGGTTISSGKLIVANTSGSATGSGTVTLTGGTLASFGTTGSIAGAVNSTGGTVAPGDIGAIGSLSLGSTLSLTAASTLNFDINGGTKDLLTITGALSVTGTPSITLATSGTLSGDYLLATFAASGLTNSNFNLGATPSGYNWDVESTFIKLIAVATSVPAGSGTWKNGNADGLWDTNIVAGSNWATAIPNASGHIATFADTAAGGTTPGTVNLVTAKTIGGIVLNTASAGYTLGTGASPSLTLQVPSGSASIQVSGGAAHTIAAHTIIASNTTINADSGTSLTFSNGLSNASSTLSITGDGAVHASAITNTGTMSFAGTGAHSVGNIGGASSVISSPAATLAASGATSLVGNVQVNATRIWQNTLTIGDATSTTGAKLKIAESSPSYADDSLVPAGNDNFVSVVKNLSIYNAGGFKGTLDLGNNDLVIDYTGGSSPVTSIEAMVASGYNGGNWLGKGITSSTAALNTGRYALTVIDNATIPTHLDNFDGVDTSNHNQVIVKFSWVADIDLDGLVTSNDAITFAAHYTEGAPANHQTGDLNYNGVFDSNDAILFAAAYSESLPHLPEPASLGILALGAGALLLKRRK